VEMGSWGKDESDVEEEIRKIGVGKWTGFS
jgi:hypothetical protein